jgi:hypothetical protein
MGREALPLTVFDERRPFAALGFIDAADTPLITGFVSTSGALLRIDKVLISTDDTVAVTVQLLLDDTLGDTVPISTVDLPPGAGTTDGVPAAEMLALAGLTDAGIVLENPINLKINVVTAMSVGTKLYLCALGGYV